MQRDLLQQIDREDVENDYRKTYQTGSKALFFAQCKDQNETWLPLVEKAYAKAHGDYASLAGGWIGEGVEDLSGGVTTELLSSDILDTDEFWDKEMSRVNQEFVFGASTGLLEHGYGERNGISEGHAYIVMEARTLSNGQRMVKLRNPWGKIRKGIWEGAWSDGSKEWTREMQEELDHKFGSDSVFWIAYQDLIRKYTHFDRTRLFRDLDWRCCQRWIGVDVPWKAQYHEKFQIKLTQDSPLVLVLSQLDGRYFKGLRGQYTFRLHFRVHSADRPEAEDYIVRSHGNYLMERSVSVELPDMPAGQYVVYLKVTGERDPNASSVEDIVKRECAKRIENEKLAQVGYAYDLAHSKAWDHMEKVAELRQKKEQKKASGCRQKERRRMWQKREINREINRQQTKKNKEKRQRRRDDWEAEQARLDEEFNARARAERDQKIKEKVAKAKAKAEAEAKSEMSRRSAEMIKGLSLNQDRPDVEADNSSISTGSPQFTPKTETSSVDAVENKQEVPPVSGPPPSDPTPVPAEEEEPLPTRVRPAYESTGESSDSPVEDWEDLYSSDDMARKPRVSQANNQAQIPDDCDTEEERMPDPWNAICIVGIRVYSKDENLELRTVMEGGELLEDGMGEKGAADLDNAQANAGGVRAVDKDEAANPDKDVEDGKKSPIKDWLHIDSADTTRFNTPMPTPYEVDRRLETNR